MARPATAAPLIPAPGTGHGVLTGDPPSDPRSEALAHTPGIGGACDANPGELGFFGLGFFSDDPAAIPEVGTPMSVCIRDAPAATLNVSITPPRGHTIVIPNVTLTRALHVDPLFSIVILPSPPRTRYQITHNDGAITLVR